jgi:CheY-like chemotaxis protein
MNDPLAFVVANLDTALEEIRAMSGSSSATLRKIEKMLTDARAGAAAVTQIVGGLETFSRSEEERPQDVDLVALEPPSSAARRGAVLVVDDEPDVCAAIRRVLATHDVTIVNDGRSALELLATGKEFDVVLSDLLMPRMSGMALFQAIVDLHPGMAKRVVFITGGAFTPEAHTFLDRVRNERVAKPFDSKELRKTVQRFVG